MHRSRSTILVRNPEASHDGCRILYRDIGDYLKREEKLAVLREAGSIAGIEDWQTITPDRHHDWIGQRSEEFQKLYPMGSKAAKAGRTDEAVFKLYSRGLATGRDAYIYNFSRDACAENAHRMVENYLGALRERDKFKNGSPTDEIIHEITGRHSSNVRWDRELKNNLRRRKEVSCTTNRIWATQYRPFVKQHCYVEYTLVTNKYQMDSIFPAVDSENRVICVPGIGSTKPFSALVADTMPDLELISKGQCFPRYRYREQAEVQRELPGIESGRERIDNISDTALRAFRVRYNDNTITKDAIFDYVYGVLHASAYRERFANDLAKELPRIPLAPDFHAFAKAGRELAELHLGYETCVEYPLEIVFAREGEPRPEQIHEDPASEQAINLLLTGGAAIVREVLSSSVFNITLGSFATLPCMECGQPIRKRLPHGQSEASAKCYEYECDASYMLVDKGNGQIEWKPHQQEVECVNNGCERKIIVWLREIAIGKSWICLDCKGRNTFAIGVRHEPVG